MIDYIQNIDWSILHGIHNVLNCKVLDFIMPKITILGNGGMIWIISATAMIISRKYRKYGITMLAALAAGVLVGNVCLKNLVARPRPCWLETVNLLIANPKDYSFPSGHTLSSVIGAFIIMSADRRFGIIAIVTAALIAFSRLYLYVHFPSDVLTSVVIGLFIGFAAISIMNKILHKKKTLA